LFRYIIKYLNSVLGSSHSSGHPMERCGVEDVSDRGYFLGSKLHDKSHLFWRTISDHWEA